MIKLNTSYEKMCQEISGVKLGDQIKILKTSPCINRFSLDYVSQVHTFSPLNKQLVNEIFYRYGKP
jgi:hypothetical protein